MDGLQETVRSEADKSAKLSILVTVPNTGWMRKEVAMRLLWLQTDGRYRLRFHSPTEHPLENNQHHIIKRLLAGDEDYWLSIDSDVAPMKNPLDLVELDKDIVACPTPIWHYTRKKGERPIYWGAYDYVEDEDAYREHEPKDGLQRVDAITGSCFLVARRVFEHPDMQTGAFTRELYPDGTVHKGNDISFCERARASGFEIWAHYDYICSHFKRVDLAMVSEAIVRLME